MKHKVIHFATEHPKRIYLIVWALVLMGLALIPGIQIDTDPENMLSNDNPARIFHNQVKQDFSLYDSIVVGVVSEHADGVFNVQTLTQIHHLTQQILNLEPVVSADLLALSTADNIGQSTPGTLRFEYLMKDAPLNQADATAIGDAVARLPLLNNTIVSGDGKAAAIYVPLYSKDDSYQVAQDIRAIIEQAPLNDQVYITGLPVAENQFGHEMFVQMGIAAPMAGAMIFFLMWYFFRSIPLVAAPMMVAMATVISVMGALIGMGFTVHIMSSMIAIFLMPIAVVDSVHIMSDFTDRYRPNDDAKQTITEVIEDLFNQMLFTSITSAVGFYSLMLTPIPPVQIFGAFVGTGILLAFAFSILLIPAYVVRMAPETLETMQKKLHDTDASHKKGSILARLMTSVGAFASNNAKSIVFVSGFIIVFSLWGMTKINVNDNPVRWFKSDHEIRIADDVLNKHFAGTYDAYLVFNDDRPLVADKTQLNRLNTLLTQAQLDKDVVSAEIKRLENNDVSSFQTLLIALDDASFEEGSESRDEGIEQATLLLEKINESSRRFLNPEVLDWMQTLQDDLLATGLIGKSNAVTDIVKTVNRELHSGDSNDYQLPSTAAGVSQTLLQFQSSHRPQDLWHFVDKDYRQALIWMQLTSGDNQHMSNIITYVDEYIATHPLPEKMSINWAGKAYINVVWQDSMVVGMMESLASAFFIVFLMMALLFRSPLYAVIAMMPLTITITFIYGLVGWLGKDYDMPIAGLSALALGLSVDFAIHFLERARSLHKQTNSVNKTLSLMFEEPARAISRNAIVVAIGFTPLLAAPLVPYITVGVLMAGIMAISAVVTLLLLPALLHLFSRWALPTK
jgi:predicted RND superfamily exporter protein